MQWSHLASVVSNEAIASYMYMHVIKTADWLTCCIVSKQVAAGGKLYNVVVDSEQTGKLLLEKGGLRRRITIIPLNKIEGSSIPQRVQETASKLVSFICR